MPTKQAPDDNPSLPATGEEPVRDDPEMAATGRRWCTGTRLLVAATAAWTIFLVLHILFAGRWWPWFIFESTPPLTAVAVPLLLLIFVRFARPVRRWLSVVLVFLLLVGVYLAGYGRGWTGAVTGTSPDTGIKVFVWNTAYWEMQDDKDAFYAFLRRQDADVYLLQEHLYATGGGPYRHVIRIDDSARLRAEFPDYQLSIDGAFVTLSRLPIVATHHQPVPGTGPEDWHWKGTKAQRTDILVGGRAVSFYNVQLPVPFRLGDNPFRGSLSRLFKEQTIRMFKEQGAWRLKELRKLRTDLAGNPHPAVVAGDFNSPWMELYPLGAGTKAHRPPRSLAPPTTWPVTDYPLPRLWHLDWLYTKGDVAVSGYQIAGSAGLSDHLPQKFRVGLPPRS